MKETKLKPICGYCGQDRTKLYKTGEFCWSVVCNNCIINKSPVTHIIKSDKTHCEVCFSPFVVISDFHICSNPKCSRFSIETLVPNSYHTFANSEDNTINIHIITYPHKSSYVLKYDDKKFCYFDVEDKSTIFLNGLFYSEIVKKLYRNVIYLLLR